MRYLLIITVLSLNISCGSASSGTNSTPATALAPVIKVDPILAPYYQSFLEAAVTQGFDYSQYPISIQFGSVEAEVADSDAVGLCQYATSPRAITIDPTFWQAAPEGNRQDLVFHELGHCILNRAHMNSTTTPLGTQGLTGIGSIMFYTVFDDSDFYSQYIQELFHPAG